MEQGLEAPAPRRAARERRVGEGTKGEGARDAVNGTAGNGRLGDAPRETEIRLRIPRCRRREGFEGQ
jgi:hypothetical protein